MEQSGLEVRARLQQAAVELFRTQGFDRTTAAQIAARAGVTERTFFRYFPDKREVLFEGQAVLRHALTASIADAPGEFGPLAMLFRAFRSVVPILEANRPFSEPRQDVINATQALQERELAKIAALSDDLASALQARGITHFRAALAARTSVAAFAQATNSWLKDQGAGLTARIDEAEAELKALL